MYLTFTPEAEPVQT